MHRSRRAHTLVTEAIGGRWTKNTIQTEGDVLEKHVDTGQ